MPRLIAIAAADYNDIPLRLLGPIRPRVSKINNKYRFKLTIKCKNNKRFRIMMKSLMTEYMKDNKNKASLAVDMNAFN